jgi:hypothetical protein
MGGNKKAMKHNTPNPNESIKGVQDNVVGNNLPSEILWK